MLDQIVEVTNAINYLFYSKHRGRPSNDISVWNISFTEELDCFKESVQEGWNVGDNYWGFIIHNKHFQILGENTLNSNLCFAKFKGDEASLFHGYPADLKNKPKDKPKNLVLNTWLEKNLITKSTYRKIQQGQI